MVGGEDLPDLFFVEELASLLCRLDFALDGFVVTSFFDAEEEDEEDFILASSASRAGARVLTTDSRSDWSDRD